MNQVPIHRTQVVLRPDSRRVLFRPFEIGDTSRIARVVGRVTQLSDEEVDQQLDHVWSEFGQRHHRLRDFFQRRYEAVRPYLLTDATISPQRQQLIGSYFTQEYALESAALFNPSMVWAPDQTGLEEGQRRFIISLRATGEGHISSLCFRSGTIDEAGQIEIDKAAKFVTAPIVVPDSQYNKALFEKKLAELELANGVAERVFAALPDQFTLDQLKEVVDNVLTKGRAYRDRWEPIAGTILALAKANYDVQCEDDNDISRHCIFPYSHHETNGIEDARFVCFEDQGEQTYYATYTAYDGRVTFPQLVETKDFSRFRINTLNGPEVQNKGMALFPRKVNDRYAMLSRQDGENLYLMYSDSLHFWYRKELLIRPTYPWEFIQVGNCGSPIETEAGWLVLSHGVGPMRKYSMGAYLLDLDDPSKVIGRSRVPFLVPDENEREGYVPNVVYSCGAVIHGEHLVLPYAMADYATTFALVELKPLLESLV
ncbi:MAG: glycoside hydrolase family 130 protein [Novipirellula sp. JB048]